jgi:hypothetical protein
MNLNVPVEYWTVLMKTSRNDMLPKYPQGEGPCFKQDAVNDRCPLAG